MATIYDFIQITEYVNNRIYTHDNSGDGRLLADSITMTTDDANLVRNGHLTWNGVQYRIEVFQQQSTRVIYDHDSDGNTSFEQTDYFWYVQLENPSGDNYHFLLPDDSLRNKFLFNINSIQPNGNTGWFHSILNFRYDKNITIAENPECFTRGTKVKTKNGEIPIEALKKGDEVWTLDRGLQKIRWIGGKRISAKRLASNPKLKPIRIKKGALGNGLPCRDLTVSRQHRILVRSKIAERLFNSKEVLIPAIKLIGMAGIEIVDQTEPVDYWHILFDHHEVIWAEGAPAESLYCGTEAMKSISPEAYEEILTIFPELSEPDFRVSPARFVPEKGKLMKNLIARHQKNRKPLLECISL